MSNLRKINSIYEDILSKVKYDDVNERYYIDVIDYALFSFDKKNYFKFISICNENNIYLEVSPKILGDRETNDLFRKIKCLKEEIDRCKDLIRIDDLEKEIIYLKNRLFEGYQLVIWRIIGNNFPDIKDSIYKDDIIQMGYVYLVRAINNFNVDKAPSFDWYLSNYVLNNVFRDIKYIDRNIMLSKDLTKLKNVSEDIIENGNYLVTLEDLVKKTGFSEEKVNELLSLEGLINIDSVDAIKELLCDIELECENIVIYIDEDNSLEQKILNESFREKLVKLINTLPNEIQRSVIIRYFGLDGKCALNFMEMNNVLGITRQGVQYHLSNGIENLKHPLRLKYLRELIRGYTELEFLDDNLDIDDSKIEKYKYDELEMFLLNQLPKEELLDLIMLLDIKYQKILLSYLGIINSNLSYDDRVKELGVSVNTYLKRRECGLIQLRKLIKERYVLDCKNEEIESSMDYLMYRYLNGSKNKVRSR